MSDGNTRKRKHPPSLQDKAPVGLKEIVQRAPHLVPNNAFNAGVPIHPGATMEAEVQLALARLYRRDRSEYPIRGPYWRLPLIRRSEAEEEDDLISERESLLIDDEYFMTKSDIDTINKRNAEIEKDIKNKRLDLLHKIFPQLPVELRMEINDRVRKQPNPIEFEDTDIEGNYDYMLGKQRKIHRYEGWKE